MDQRQGGGSAHRGRAIPDCDHNGNLPPGIHRAALEDLDTFAWNARRRDLLGGLRRALAALAAAGVRRVWIDGSFVTSKPNPNDVDGCWEYGPWVDVNKLDPVFLRIRPPREDMRSKYGVDFLISGTPLRDPEAHGRPVEEFFQVDEDGNPKGILLIEIQQQP
jgi:hypothetical protein